MVAEVDKPVLLTVSVNVCMPVPLVVRVWLKAGAVVEPLSGELPFVSV